MLKKNDVAIILFIYNRPEHTAKVIEGLKKNNIEKLYVFSDEAKKNSEKQMVEKTRQLIRKIDWCEVEATYSRENRGLANSIIFGITQIINKGYESFIVLEDDCVPKPNFVDFMIESLDYYKDIPEIMHVSGFGLPIKNYTKKDVYITPYPCSWGWGTWSDTWKKCDFNQYENYNLLLQDKKLKKQFNYAGEAFSEFLQMQLDGKVNSWLIRWYFYIFQNKGKCIWCYNSLIENKGFDGSGVHKNKIDRFNQKTNLVNTGIKRDFVFEDDLTYNNKLIREFRRHFMGKKLLEKIKTTIYLLTGIIVGK